MTRFATITATGMCVPDTVLTNADLSARLGTDIDDFVSNVLGIRERRVCAADESVADLAERAGRAALAARGIRATDIDLLIVATDTPEYITPATSSEVHGRLGTHGAGTFDVNSACAGFVTALDIAGKYIVADARYRRILVIAAYAMSKYVDYTDKKTSTIFADGAGAVIVEASAEPGIVATELRADGRLVGGMGVFAGGTKEPVTADVLATGDRNRLRFVTKYPAEVNEEGWPDIARTVLERAGADTGDVDLWLWTQVNRSTIEVVMRSLGVPLERAHLIMEHWGYTGSACLPMALHDALERGRVKDGDLLMLTGSGAGLAMGALALRWNPHPVEA